MFVRREFRSGAISGIGSKGDEDVGLLGDDDDDDDGDDDEVMWDDCGSGECGAWDDDEEDGPVEGGGGAVGGGVNPDWTADTAAAHADWRLGLL